MLSLVPSAAHVAANGKQRLSKRNPDNVACHKEQRKVKIFCHKRQPNAKRKRCIGRDGKDGWASST